MGPGLLLYLHYRPYAQPGLSMRSESLLVYFYRILPLSKVLHQFLAMAMGGWSSVSRSICVHIFNQNAILWRALELLLAGRVFSPLEGKVKFIPGCITPRHSA